MLICLSIGIWLVFFTFYKVLGYKIFIFCIIGHFLLLLYSGCVIKKLNLQANIDDLTGVSNRRYFSLKIPKLLKTKSPVSLIMIDIDDFKRINDIYGHSTGDEFLKQFAEILKNNIRSYDIVARLGGDEFAVVMAQTHHENVLKMAERIKKAIEEYTFITDSINEKMTISIGIATVTFPTQIECFLNHADRALYCAKERKNAIVAYE